MPNINKGTLDRTAAVDINILHLEIHIDTIRVLLFFDILADHLAPDIIWPVGDSRGQDAAGVCAEDNILRHEEVVTQYTGLVVLDGFPFLELREGTTGVLRSL